MSINQSINRDNWRCLTGVTVLVVGLLTSLEQVVTQVRHHFSYYELMTILLICMFLRDDVINKGSFFIMDHFTSPHLADYSVENLNYIKPLR